MGRINFVDIAYLTKDNLIDGRLVYTRRKTKKLIKLPLQANAIDFLDRYKNSDNLCLFPILSIFHKTDQQKANRVHKVIIKVNKYLKVIDIWLVKLPDIPTQFLICLAVLHRFLLQI